MFKATVGRSVTIAVAMAGVALALLPGGAANAAAGTAEAAGKDGPLVCVTVLDKVEPGATFSRIASRQCAADKEDALAATVGVVAAVQIFTLIEHSNYGGAYDHVYGGARCDAAGYRINPGWYEWRLSSFLVDGGCRYTTLTNHSGSSKRFAGDTPYVGSAYNDNVDAIRTTS